MDIFIGNLPGRKYEPEILGLLKNFDSHTKAAIKKPIHKHRENGYFCVASIDHDKTAKRFINKFNQKSPYGHRLNIREYVHRCYGNERRNINWRDSNWQGHEKRGKDRRVYIAQTEI